MVHNPQRRVCERCRPHRQRPPSLWASMGSKYGCCCCPRERGQRAILRQIDLILMMWCASQCQHNAYIFFCGTLYGHCLPPLDSRYVASFDVGLRFRDRAVLAATLIAGSPTYECSGTSTKSQCPEQVIWALYVRSNDAVVWFDCLSGRVDIVSSTQCTEHVRPEKMHSFFFSFSPLLSSSSSIRHYARPASVQDIYTNICRPSIGIYSLVHHTAHSTLPTICLFMSRLKR